MAAIAEQTIRLGEIAHARSGDKGNHANVGVIAFTPAGYAYLKQVLTAAKVGDYFAPLAPSSVVRYELENLGALNFLVHDVLGGGGIRSLHTDAQGKALGQSLLQMRIPRPTNVGQMVRRT